MNLHGFHLRETLKHQISRKKTTLITEVTALYMKENLSHISPCLLLKNKKLALVSNYTNIYICAHATPIYTPIYFKVITHRVTVNRMIFAELGP